MLVRFLQAHGFAAERVPLSGSAGGSYCGDITVPVIGRDLTVEVKVGATASGRCIGGSTAAIFSSLKPIAASRSLSSRCASPQKSPSLPNFPKPFARLRHRADWFDP